jgi:hypothetical protein
MEFFFDFQEFLGMFRSFEVQRGISEFLKKFKIIEIFWNFWNFLNFSEISSNFQKFLGLFQDISEFSGVSRFFRSFSQCVNLILSTQLFQKV